MIDIKTITKRDKYIKAIEDVVDRYIMRAVRDGDSSCIFPVDPWSYTRVEVDGESLLLDGVAYFNELKALYEENGYKVVRSAPIGGVAQKCYEIFW